jgi:DNA excision repair protein ERCC-3
MKPGVNNPFGSNPLIVQSDMSVLAMSDHENYEEIRRRLSEFADLVKMPGRIHMYKMTRLTLWNAANNGLRAQEIVGFLEENSGFALPHRVRGEIYHIVGRYGMAKIVSQGGRLYLHCPDSGWLQTILETPGVNDYVTKSDDDGLLLIHPGMRGLLKQTLVKAGIPVQDVAGYRQGQHLDIGLASEDRDGRPFQLRDYQREAIERWLDSASGGSGIVVLPCGAGKTIVGIGAIARLRCETLILTTNITSVRQWINEIIQRTTADARDVGEYSGERKEVRPITVATYHILTHRARKGDAFAHLKLFQERNWGLIIYDEVHLLPAPVFRATADLQATRRLGLTATLVREDGLEEDVFSLIGPRCYSRTWRSLEKEGWISKVRCVEILVPLPPDAEIPYERAANREKIRIAGENRAKLGVLKAVLRRHAGEPTLIIGQYLDQLREISAACRAPIVSGEMNQARRDELYARFRKGEIPILVVSKVANFAVDLPDATVAIQVSGCFGSRQEEAQRLGRILRPKEDGKAACFYSLVSENTREQEFAHKRRLFLAEQGYEYEMTHASQWVEQDARKVIT